MLIQLSIDVWMDVLDFLRGYRRELAEKCNQLGDRTFVNDICVLWLHKRCRNVKLRYLRIKAKDVSSKDGLSQPKKRGQLIVWDWKINGVQVFAEEIFAEVPMPENIISFEKIRIEYLDWQVLNFLRFFTNNYIINMFIYDDNENMRTALGHLLPLLTNGIGSFGFHFDTWIHFPSILDQFPDQLFSAQKLFLSTLGEHTESLVRWLSTPLVDMQPRMATLNTSIDIDIVNRIREQFLAATSPVSFYLCFRVPLGAAKIQVQESSYENGTTGEQLIMRKCREVGYDWENLLIGRCQTSIVDGNAWLQGMRRKEDEMKQQKKPFIFLCQPLLGPMESEEEENDNDDGRKPGPSNKRI